MNGIESRGPPEEADTGADLSAWFHSQKEKRKIPDTVVKAVWETGYVTFVFHQKSQETKVTRTAAVAEEQQ